MKRVGQLSSDADHDKQRHQRPAHQLRQRVHPIRLFSLSQLFSSLRHKRGCVRCVWHARGAARLLASLAKHSVFWLDNYSTSRSCARTCCPSTHERDEHSEGSPACQLGVSARQRSSGRHCSDASCESLSERVAGENAVVLLNKFLWRYLLSSTNVYYTKL